MKVEDTHTTRHEPARSNQHICRLDLLHLDGHETCSLFTENFFNGAVSYVQHVSHSTKRLRFRSDWQEDSLDEAARWLNIKQHSQAEQNFTTLINLSREIVHIYAFTLGDRFHCLSPPYARFCGCIPNHASLPRHESWLHRDAFERIL